MEDLEYTVSLRFKYTVEDPLRVARYIQNQSFLYRYDALLFAVMVFIGFVLLIVLMASNLSELDTLGLASLILGAAFFSLIPTAIIGVTVYLVHKPLGGWLAKRRVTKYFASSPIMNDEKLIEFSSEGIKISGDLSSSFLKWASITRAVESETDMMFYTGNEKFGWFIPKTAFESNGDLIIIRKLLRKELDEKVRLLRIESNP